MSVSSFKSLVWMSLVTCAFLSCTVLEDRTDCPCYLTIDLPDQYERLFIDISSVDGFEVAEYVRPSSFPDGLILAVPRGRMRVSVSDRDDWIIPLGEDCPELYFAVDELDTDVEAVTLEPRMCKQYCTMTIVMDGAGERLPVMKVRGDVCGYDVFGQPLPGEFLHRLESSSLRVPRQRGPTLLLEVGNTLTLPVGLYLEEAGYDWNESDLQDVTLEIHSREAMVSVATDKWRKSLSFDLVI